MTPQGIAVSILDTRLKFIFAADYFLSQAGD